MSNHACDIAKSLVSGDRAKQYGPFVNNAVYAANVAHCSVETVYLVMIGLKLSREQFKHKRDNIVDAIGYLALLDDLKGNK
jgi:hypothetical protein